MRSISFDNFGLLSKGIKELIYNTHMEQRIDSHEDPGYIEEIKERMTSAKMKVKSILKNYDKEKLFDVVNEHVIEYADSQDYEDLVDNGEEDGVGDHITLEILSKIKLGIDYDAYIESVGSVLSRASSRTSSRTSSGPVRRTLFEGDSSISGDTLQHTSSSGSANTLTSRGRTKRKKKPSKKKKKKPAKEKPTKRKKKKATKGKKKKKPTKKNNRLQL